MPPPHPTPPVHFKSCVTAIHLLFIASLNPNVDPSSSLSLPQSSVDHKEFKRCGPFDPYINAKVCTQRCWKLFFLSAPLLSCCVSFAVLCCAWAYSVCCCLRGATLLQGYQELSDFYPLRENRSPLPLFSPPHIDHDWDVEKFSKNCIRALLLPQTGEVFLYVKTSCLTSSWCNFCLYMSLLEIFLCSPVAALYQGCLKRLLASPR